MYWTEFLTVALIHLLAVASPGPDFAVVVRESVTHGRRAGMFTAFGVGTAIFVHVGYRVTVVFKRRAEVGSEVALQQQAWAF